MLCALCLSMFHNDLLGGLHHSSLENLEKAARNGCKICIYLLTRRDQFGPDLEREKSATPFLTYQWEFSDNDWSIEFDSDIKWLSFYGQHFNYVYIYASDSAVGPEDWYIDLIKVAESDLTAQPWSVRRDAFPSRPIPDNLGHPHVLELAKSWLRNCEKVHDCENLNGTEDSKWCPKRLIDLSDPEVPPRLLEREREVPKSRYAALSHCWGPNPEFVTLTRDNLDEFRQGIPINLPRSFRDAISTCRYLGIDYLWIDSLCIIQDGAGYEEDWLLHTDEMASVYLNCCVNLSFAGAGRAEVGVFADRNADFLQSCYVFSCIPDQNPQLKGPIPKRSVSDLIVHAKASGKTEEQSKPMADHEPSLPADDWCDAENPETDIQPSASSSSSSSIRPPSDALALCESRFSNSGFRAISKARKYAVLCRSDLHWALSDQPLFDRAWAFQERLLAPRVLHFMQDRIAWECGGVHFLSEYFHTDPRQDLGYEFNIRSNEGWDKRDISLASQDWTSLVRFYTTRRLRYPEKDRLTAFAAIAQRYASFLGDGYFAGHFVSEMPKDLLWSSDPPQLVEPKSPERPHLTERARRTPTWSWTSVDTRVIHLHYWLENHEIADLAGLVDVQVKLVNQAYKFGPVRSGYLRIRGLLSKCLIEGRDFRGRDFRRRSNPERANCVFHAQYGDRDIEKLSIELSISLDEPNKQIGAGVYALLLVQFRATSKSECDVTGGIFIEKHPENNTIYRRIGVFDTTMDGSWGTENASAFVSNHRVIDYYHRYAGCKEVVEIV